MKRELGGRIVVLGAAGMLAYAVIGKLRRLAPPIEVHAFDHGQLDITDRRASQRVLEELRPSIVVNCAACTNVDGCESNAEIARRVNERAPGELAEACRTIGAFLVHYSTDFVFDGVKREPYLESDPTNPQTEYGRSKLGGERAITAVGSPHLIIRTSWLFGANGRNFVDAIAAKAERDEPLHVVCDQIGRPTFSHDLADATIRLLQAGMEGIVHFSNDGQCSWHEFACEIVRLMGLYINVEPIKSLELNRPAKRPGYSVLSLDKYKAVTHATPRNWKEALKVYLAARKEATSAA